LLAPARILAQAKGKDSPVITRAIVEEVKQLFLDAKTSAKILISTEGFVSQ
jgi:DNA helicase TIP49 (TBP-interacting protein)